MAPSMSSVSSTRRVASSPSSEERVQHSRETDQEALRECKAQGDGWRILH